MAVLVWIKYLFSLSPSRKLCCCGEKQISLKPVRYWVWGELSCFKMLHQFLCPFHSETLVFQLFTSFALTQCTADSVCRTSAIPGLMIPTHKYRKQRNGWIDATLDCFSIVTVEKQKELLANAVSLSMIYCSSRSNILMEHCYFSCPLSADYWHKQLSLKRPSLV